jgi:hypothetical protein
MVTGCDPGVTNQPSSYVTGFDQLPEKAAILSAQSQTTAAGKDLTMETYLWRDFMPSSEPDGSPLIASVTIKTVDLSPFPGSVTPVEIYVVNGHEVWVSAFSDETRPPQPEYQVNAIARGGPKWGPDIYVDVAVKLMDGNGAVSFLRLDDQYISATF